jgi:hypothetical protein
MQLFWLCSDERRALSSYSNIGHATLGQSISVGSRINFRQILSPVINNDGPVQLFPILKS